MNTVCISTKISTPEKSSGDKNSPPLQKVGGHVPLSTHGSTPMKQTVPRFVTPLVTKSGQETGRALFIEPRSPHGLRENIKWFIPMEHMSLTCPADEHSALLVPSNGDTSDISVPRFIFYSYFHSIPCDKFQFLFYSSYFKAVYFQFQFPFFRCLNLNSTSSSSSGNNKINECNLSMQYFVSLC